MFILGHTGIAAALVRRLDRTASLRAVAVAALLPDLVDKPVALLFPGFANGWTRLAAHSLTGLGVFALGASLVLGRRAWPLVLAYASHLLLDRMWGDPEIVFWPWTGLWVEPHPLSYWERLGKLDLYTIAGEVAGLAGWWWVWPRERGVDAPPPL
jgi:hypothetical protein